MDILPENTIHQDAIKKKKGLLGLSLAMQLNFVIIKKIKQQKTKSRTRQLNREVLSSLHS